MKLYMAWQRDVLMYKTIALMNLAYIYLMVRSRRYCLNKSQLNLRAHFA
jgi:hypothetical protein